MTNFLQPVFLLFALGFQAPAAAVGEEIIYAQIGEDVPLNVPHNPNKYIYWYFNSLNDKPIASFNPFGGKDIDKDWKTRLTLSSGSVVIRNLTQSDFGVFSCSVKQKTTEVAKYGFRLIQLNVAVDPPVLLPGERLSLACAAVTDHAPQIHWLSPQGQRIDGRSVDRVGSVHSGQWTCVVSRAGKEKRVVKKITVIDLRPPVPTQYTSARNPLAVSCSLAADATWDQVKSKGVREVGWNFCPAKPPRDKSSLLLLSLEDHEQTWKTLTDRAVRPSLNTSSGDLSLGRNLAREEDAGDYECFVRFGNGVTLNRTARVEVLRINAEPRTELKTGQPLNLTCTTDRPPPPDMQIHWLPPSSSSSSPPSPSPSGLDLHSPHLAISRVESLHNGTWRCQLRRGETVLTSAEVALNIEPKFNVWLVMTLCAAALILILVVILLVILPRHRQRRTRRHMRLCQCKNPKPKGFYRS